MGKHREVEAGGERLEVWGFTMRVRLTTLLIVTLLAMPALAHHSAVAEYDLGKPVKVTGTVTRVEWSNPHIWFYVDVKNQDGSVNNWGFSGGAPGVLQRRGISRTAMKPGDMVVVEGFRAKDGSFNGSGNNVTFPDGRRVFTAMEGFQQK
jgi:DNA/RNA endonuclease YhcR with UshA esterase domain